MTSTSTFLLSRGDGRSSTSGSVISDGSVSPVGLDQPAYEYSDSMESVTEDEDQQTPLLPDLRSPVPIQRPTGLIISDYLAFPPINRNNFTYSSGSHDSGDHSSNSLPLALEEYIPHEAEDTSGKIPDRDAPEGSSLASTSNVNVLNSIV